MLLSDAFTLGNVLYHRKGLRRQSGRDREDLPVRFGARSEFR